MAVAAALASAAPPCPPARPGEPAPVSSDPDWLVKPTPENIWWAYPPAAMEANVKGKVIIRCEVSVDGLAENCAVVSEDQPGFGFGEAALTLAKDMRFKPRLACGVAVRSEIRVPLNFNLPGVEAEGALAAGPPPSADAVALARRLVEDLKIMEMVDEEPDEQVTMALFGPQRANLNAAERKAYYEAVNETWQLARRKVESALVGSYARRMTRQELAQAVGFYESPVGRKVVEQLGVSRDDVGREMEIAQPQLMREFQERYCGKTRSCDPDDAI